MFGVHLFHKMDGYVIPINRPAQYQHAWQHCNPLDGQLISIINIVIIVTILIITLITNTIEYQSYWLSRDNQYYWLWWVFSTQIHRAGVGVALKHPANQRRPGELIVPHFLFSCVTLSQTARLIPEVRALLQNKSANSFSSIARHLVITSLVFFDMQCQRWFTRSTAGCLHVFSAPLWQHSTPGSLFWKTKPEVDFLSKHRRHPPHLSSPLPPRLPPLVSSLDRLNVG